ncbi:MAG: bifunctional diaminohydroxyphosphoribosylaminopyrimidine deaminase/5-amino-6-(5-phosphoribosylamino)uracil reductase RibD [Candidatus Aceula meridiana]|nr:bifunctional diaminohydroxyphosphoribosylaminopyrimidine deaminase/5-amino-6-(5-phosphoribosylamino)uracil reductase RibD [Candidatus Aceula meridiana]
MDKTKISTQDSQFMYLALELALKAKGKTSPNPLVGAVVVKNNKIVGQGYHRRCGVAHAESVALKQAGMEARGATLYVTLEPCGHFGRTPPCVDSIIANSIREVIVGTKDPNPVNNGKSILKLRRAGIKVKVGCLKEDLEKINEPFFKHIAKKMPFVVVKCAQTLDGKIATAQGHSRWITSSGTRDISHKLRDDFDAILVGINTVLKDNPYLNAKSQAKRLKKIIVDSTLKIPLRGNLYKNTKASDIIVATTKKASSQKLNKLVKKGACVLVCPSKNGQVDLKVLFKKLAQKEILSLLVEGGAKVIGSVLAQKLADKIWIFVAPKIIGDQSALSAIDGLGTQNVNKAISLERIQIYPLAKDFLIEGYIA